MTGFAFLLVLALFVVVTGVVVILLTNRPDQGLAQEVAGLRELVADLKDIAYDHRELDSALSVIITDRIRTYERRELP